MAHGLKVDMKNAIRTLLKKGASHRQTNSMLRIDRKTVGCYAGDVKNSKRPTSAHQITTSKWARDAPHN